MGLFVFLPLVLPLTAWPIARLAEQRLHPRTATRLLTGVAVVTAVCSTVCLALLMVVGTAQLPGNPLPDGWSDPEVRAAVPYDEVAGRLAIPALLAVVVACGRTLWRHGRVRRRAHRALAGLPGTEVAVLPDEVPYAYALPGGRRDRVVVTTALLASLEPAERRALFAHERAHLAARHHRLLLAVRLAARANPFLRPLRTAVSYTAERWADEDAARAVGSRRVVARAIGKAALLSAGSPVATLAGFAASGPVPRRVAALLGPAPAARSWPPVFTSVGLAAWGAAVGAALSAMSSANSAVTMALILYAATPL
ncbi:MULTISPECIES: M56 family metallopeptidase [Streptomyces]|uniref:Putative integral membrane protein n=1 Tax=Streptomyces scabiei (strain 87.22) TaxID=680198 RepID=C9ZHT1_STRSW|nr:MULTISPECIES: M56 family metallopeptidase [Streptomyces]MBP5872111.1 M56 family metallopeptidase [Streptomyces sp. LBUM 1485]MBP5933503.1 M56 family metallopeptidase [Streptomyces sp. LBUM 1479]KFG06728.1 membrane protein [Streptomyces scabiei]MBP5873879.1 M56 family metallopeptidase [Streptomyces sp. LBUM 1477]MBP5881588.1 M56 family metallopeptidase [Streptomyces sp. LBUM 1487]